MTTSAQILGWLALAAMAGACVLRAEGPGQSDASTADASPDGSNDATPSPERLFAEISIGADALAESCTGDLESFPLLVAITEDADLRTQANGGQVHHESGFDIRFRTADETTLLDHEIELYDGAAGTLVAWVRVPILSQSAATTIRLYVGDGSITAPTENPNAVWDTAFVGVWHLHDDFEDSTTAQNHCTNHGSATIAGKLADGQDFENTEDDYVDCGADISLDLTEAITVSAWIRPGSSPTTDDLFDYLTKGNVYNLQFVKGTMRPRFAYMIPAGTWNTVNSPDVIDTVSFHHVAATFDVAGGASNAKLFVDGALANAETFTEPMASTTATLTIGRWTDVRDYDGAIDEARVANLARDACWLQTEYANQLDPSSFYTLSPATRDGSTRGSIPAR